MTVRVSSLDLPDQEFLVEFERGGFASTNFPHRAHLHMAWLYVTSLGVEPAIEKVTMGIRNLARTHGHSNLYHDTLTRAWVYLVAGAATPQPCGFDAFVERNPELLDKHLLNRYYSPDLLWSPQARTYWVPPDREPIPGAPCR
jgi:hypothetical protein